MKMLINLLLRFKCQAPVEEIAPGTSQLPLVTTHRQQE